MTGSGGIFAGENPIKPENAISLLMVQILVVIFMTRILSVVLVRLKQPRVIAEVLTGIVLGPSVLGNWKAWSDTIFPEASMPVLKAFSEFGLIFFMFLVGLELDTKLMKAHMKESLIISATGIIFPFSLSIVASILLYNKFSSDEVPFTSFMLFIGVSMSITAFPVLARILTDRKLLMTKVGMTAISAAAVGDAASWVFLALVISIVNSSSSPITCVYILIVGFAFAIFMMTVVKKIVKKLMHLSSIREDLNVFMIFFTFALILASSWITEAIGIHSIFGAFLTGLIIPNESGFAIKLTEKIEDIISVLFVPLYFAYSGLQTKLSALDSWSVWCMLILVIFMACFGKIVFSAIAARFCRLTWRESLTLGVLMNTKGLVELIVLNIGREAGVIDDRVFVIMVVMAIVTTLITTPTVAAMYHPDTEKELSEKMDEEMKLEEIKETLQMKPDYNVVMCLFNINFVSPMLNILQIIYPYYNQHEVRQMQIQFNVTALRLTQLDERTSTFLMMADSGAIRRDPIYSFFQSITVNKIPINWQLAAAKITEYPDYIIQTAKRSKADLVILPWIPLDLETRQRTLENWLEVWSSGHHKDLIADVYNNTKRSAVAAFIDHGFGHFHELINNTNSIDHPLFNKRDYYDNLNSNSNIEYDDGKPKVFIPFMGGPDDREALKFVIKLSASKEIDVHILRIRKLDMQLNEDENQNTVNSVKSDSSNFSNMIYMLPDDEETKKDDEFIHHVNQYIKARGKITLEALIAGQFNEKDARKYGIKVKSFNNGENHCDITDKGTTGMKKKTKKESKIKKGRLFKKEKEKNKSINKDYSSSSSDKEQDSETDIAYEKPKRILPGLLVKSRENVNAKIANREKEKELLEERQQQQQQQQLQQLQLQEQEQKFYTDDDDSNETQVSFSSSGNNSLDNKPPLIPTNEDDSVEDDDMIENIIFEEVETTDPVKLAIKKCTEYGKHDLIIIGRTGAYRHHHNMKPVIQNILNNVHSNQHSVQGGVVNSTQIPISSTPTSNNPLSNLFYRRNNSSKASLSVSVNSQHTNTSNNEENNADLKGFRRRQQILLGELGGNLMALKHEVLSSIMVFRTVHKDHETIYDEEDEFGQNYK